VIDAVVSYRETGLNLRCNSRWNAAYSPKRAQSGSSEVATRISSPCVIRGEITTWRSSNRCGQYVSDSVSGHFDPWWYRGYENSVHGKCCMNVAVCAAPRNLHTLTKLQMDRIQQFGIVRVLLSPFYSLANLL